MKLSQSSANNLRTLSGEFCLALPGVFRLTTDLSDAPQLVAKILEFSLNSLENENATFEYLSLQQNREVWGSLSEVMACLSQDLEIAAGAATVEPQALMMELIPAEIKSIENRLKNLSSFDPHNDSYIAFKDFFSPQTIQETMNKIEANYKAHKTPDFAEILTQQIERTFVGIAPRPENRHAKFLMAETPSEAFLTQNQDRVRSLEEYKHKVWQVTQDLHSWTLEANSPPEHFWNEDLRARKITAIERRIRSIIEIVDFQGTEEEFGRLFNPIQNSNFKKSGRKQKIAKNSKRKGSKHSESGSQNTPKSLSHFTLGENRFEFTWKKQPKEQTPALNHSGSIEKFKSPKNFPKEFKLNSAEFQKEHRLKSNKSSEKIAAKFMSLRVTKDQKDPIQVQGGPLPPAPNFSERFEDQPIVRRVSTPKLAPVNTDLATIKAKFIPRINKINDMAIARIDKLTKKMEEISSRVHIHVSPHLSNLGQLSSLPSLSALQEDKMMLTHHNSQILKELEFYDKMKAEHDMCKSKIRSITVEKEELQDRIKELEIDLEFSRTELKMAKKIKKVLETKITELEERSVRSEENHASTDNIAHNASQPVGGKLNIIDETEEYDLVSEPSFSHKNFAVLHQQSFKSGGEFRLGEKVLKRVYCFLHKKLCHPQINNSGSFVAEIGGINRHNLGEGLSPINTYGENRIVYQADDHEMARAVQSARNNSIGENSYFLKEEKYPEYFAKSLNQKRKTVGAEDKAEFPSPEMADNVQKFQNNPKQFSFSDVTEIGFFPKRLDSSSGGFLMEELIDSNPAPAEKQKPQKKKLFSMDHIIKTIGDSKKAPPASEQRVLMPPQPPEDPKKAVPVGNMIRPLMSKLKSEQAIRVVKVDDFDFGGKDTPRETYMPQDDTSIKFEPQPRQAPPKFTKSEKTNNTLARLRNLKEKIVSMLEKLASFGPNFETQWSALDSRIKSASKKLEDVKSKANASSHRVPWSVNQTATFVGTDRPHDHPRSAVLHSAESKFDTALRHDGRLPSKFDLKWDPSGKHTIGEKQVDQLRTSSQVCNPTYSFQDVVIRAPIKIAAELRPRLASDEIPGKSENCFQTELVEEKPEPIPEVKHDSQSSNKNSDGKVSPNRQELPSLALPEVDDAEPEYAAKSGSRASNNNPLSNSLPIPGQPKKVIEKIFKVSRRMSMRNEEKPAPQAANPGPSSSKQITNLAASMEFKKPIYSSKEIVNRPSIDPSSSARGKRDEGLGQTMNIELPDKIIYKRTGTPMDQKHLDSKRLGDSAEKKLKPKHTWAPQASLQAKVRSQSKKASHHGAQLLKGSTHKIQPAHFDSCHNQLSKHVNETGNQKSNLQEIVKSVTNLVETILGQDTASALQRGEFGFLDVIEMLKFRWANDNLNAASVMTQQNNIANCATSMKDVPNKIYSTILAEQSQKNTYSVNLDLPTNQKDKTSFSDHSAILFGQHSNESKFGPFGPQTSSYIRPYCLDTSLSQVDKRNSQTPQHKPQTLTSLSEAIVNRAESRIAKNTQEMGEALEVFNRFFLHTKQLIGDYNQIQFKNKKPAPTATTKQPIEESSEFLLSYCKQLKLNMKVLRDLMAVFVEFINSKIRPCKTSSPDTLQEKDLMDSKISIGGSNALDPKNMDNFEVNFDSVLKMSLYQHQLGMANSVIAKMSENNRFYKKKLEELAKIGISHKPEVVSAANLPKSNTNRSNNSYQLKKIQKDVHKLKDRTEPILGPVPIKTPAQETKTMQDEMFRIYEKFNEGFSKNLTQAGLYKSKKLDNQSHRLLHAESALARLTKELPAEDPNLSRTKIAGHPQEAGELPPHPDIEEPTPNSANSVVYTNCLLMIIDVVTNKALTDTVVRKKLGKMIKTILKE
jgi:hypothetical protein